MDDRTVQTSVIKTSTAEVYDKASGILTQIQKHADQGCEHCLKILKNGLRPITTPDTETTNSGTNRNDQF